MVRIRLVTVLRAAAVFFFVLGVVTGLGEWVFHWWDQPWDVGSPVSLAVAGFTVLWSDLRGLRDDGRGGHRELIEGQRSMRGELVAGGRELIQGQKAMRDELVAGQRELIQGQHELVAGQREGNALLREVVASFRRP